uniref:Uncharacterized protein n=1 Tax=Electrophorus electricus TaxID=8005 RepID=A0AAY5EMH0_ELEEL
MCHGADHLTEAVPETQRLDSSLQKAKAQLSIKTRRHRPSRSRLRDSLSSMEGEDSLDGKVCVGAVPTSCAPLHASFGRSSPSPDLCLSSSPARRDRGLAPDLCPVTPEMRAEEQGPGMHRHLLSTSSQEQGTGRLSTSSQEALLPAASGFSGRPCSRSENSSPAHLHDSHDFGSDEPGSPTVLLDKKTRRSFLNLGVTLRRTYGKVRKDRSNRLSAGNRYDRTLCAYVCVCARVCVCVRERERESICGSSQEEESEPSASLLEVPGRPGRPERSQPYRSLGDPRAEEVSTKLRYRQARASSHQTPLPWGGALHSIRNPDGSQRPQNSQSEILTLKCHNQKQRASVLLHKQPRVSFLWKSRREHQVRTKKG